MRTILFWIFLSVSMSSTTVKAEAKTLRIGSYKDIEVNEVILAKDKAPNLLAGLLYRSLVELSADGDWVCYFCDSIPTLENNQLKIITKNGHKDFKATWKIKDNARWSDGSKITAIDVENIFLEQKLMVNANNWDSTIPAIKSFKIGKKKDQFTITYRGTPADYMNLSFLLFKKTLKYTPKDEAEKIEEKKLFSGPYLINRTDYQNIHLEKNPHSFMDSKFDHIHIQILKNRSAMIEKLKLGNIDIIAPSTLSDEFSAELSEAFNRESTTITTNISRSNSFYLLFLNLNNPKLRKQSFRRAIDFSLHKNSISGKAHNGDLAILTNQKFKAFLAPYDKNLAIHHLKISNEEPRLEIALNGSSSKSVRIASELKEQLESSGFSIKTKPHDREQFHLKVLERGNFSESVLAKVTFFPNELPYSLMLPSEVPSSHKTAIGQNLSRWINYDVESWIEQLRAGPKNPDKYLVSIFKAVAREIPFIPIEREKIIFYSNAKSQVTGFRDFYERPFTYYIRELNKGQSGR